MDINLIVKYNYYTFYFTHNKQTTPWTSIILVHLPIYI